MSVISITDEDIEYAESILLKAEQKFDDERIEFLKDLNTLDLQAVPGSGKTTVLLAKLLILERYMPFKNGSGILVISHTNAAIDEIKSRIGAYCPKLFSHPNFVGTIQGFVNEFLAKPYFKQSFGNDITRICDQAYAQQIKNKLTFDLLSQRETFRKVKYIFSCNESKIFNYRFSQEPNSTNLVSTINGSDLEISKPKPKSKNYQDYSDEEKSDILDYLFKLKRKVLEEGYLHFDDAYALAYKYLFAKPQIINIIQRRFSYVFVDEMQDMDKHQYQILEMLFFDGGRSKSVYQRIGDKNQAIFNGEVKLDEIWIDRETVKEITGSHRLSPLNASLTNIFSLTKSNIVGLNSDSQIKPILFVYTLANKERLIECYTLIINKLTEGGLLPNTSSEVLSVVAWVTTKKDDATKVTLPSYYPNYSREQTKPKNEYDCLAQYLICFEQTNDSLKPIASNIKNAILKSLRVTNVKDDDEKFFKESTFKKLLLEKSTLDEKVVFFEKNIYLWSINVMRGNHKHVLGELQAYIISIFRAFFPGCTANRAFIYDVYAINDVSAHPEKEDCNLMFSTVHGVKGQTHLATLYLESFYYSEYESTQMSEVFNGSSSLELIKNIGNKINQLRLEIMTLNEKGKQGAITREKEIKKLNTKIDNIKKYSKMLYVGFSRPTHLLAFAVEENRFNELTINTDLWDVVYI
ncbi:UvrD-helicase domain-containing protein [Psychromonas sp. SP041]|uniref:UvrD-helicase domain-containing protein n=1 Tax=Psychromonas sp. SP041 TaxID=1365007 RepID=UPI001485A1C1|nr:UvrD-helicase domain-containing protein [Psychromonas sp. SP041]